MLLIVFSQMYLLVCESVASVYWQNLSTEAEEWTLELPGGKKKKELPGGRRALKLA